MTDNENSEWRSADNEGKSWSVYRWKDNKVAHLRNKSDKIKRFRTRIAANVAAEQLNSQNEAKP